MHVASQLTEASVEQRDGLVEVRARVPAGIGLDLKLRFREWLFRCRRDGAELEFLDYRRLP